MSKGAYRFDDLQPAVTVKATQVGLNYSPNGVRVTEAGTDHPAHPGHGW